MKNVPEKRFRNWGIAWIGLAGALGLHVTDEALTGFLPLYNNIVGSIRDEYPWIPLPQFTFPMWFAGLVLGIVLLFVLSPLVFKGRNWLRKASYVLGALMTANALGHIGASIYWERSATGLYSSPFLLVSSLALLITAYQARSNVSDLSNKK
jgi:hypothetical protein